MVVGARMVEEPPACTYHVDCNPLPAALLLVVVLARGRVAELHAVVSRTARRRWPHFTPTLAALHADIGHRPDYARAP